MTPVTRVAVLVIALVASIVLLGAPAGSDPDPPPPTTIENEFIPEEQNLSDCISALPRPECGSESQGGWRQALILGLLVVAFAFIAWRVVRSVRRRDS